MNFKKLLTPAINWVFNPSKNQKNSLQVEIHPAGDFKSFEKPKTQYYVEAILMFLP